MKKKIIIITLFLLLVALGIASNEKVIKKWETEARLTTSESVIYDQDKDLIYVSCINGKPARKDGNGFIAQLSLDGKIKILKWVKGLDAPKGMGIFKDKLYVVDIDYLVEINRLTGKIIKKHAISRAKFLNDIAITKDGDVYMSDTFAHLIFLFKNQKVTALPQHKKINAPNGLYIFDNRLIIGSYKDGSVIGMSLTKLKIKHMFKASKSVDGLVPAGEGKWLVSEWNGLVTLVKKSGKGKPIDLLNTKDQNINAADIEYIIDKNLLLVPTFFDNRVVAYEIVFN